MFFPPVRSLAWFTASLSAIATAFAVNTARSAPAAPAELVPSASVEKDRDENPRVLPGLVKWHPTLADARAAAEQSGRPVLVFHMMGQLDRQFC